MAFLNCNGVDIPVTWNGCQVDELEVGMHSRAYDGTFRSTVRTWKREWKITTPPLVAPDADFYTDLLRGLGDVWNFDDSTSYSSKGNVFATPGTAPAYGTGGVFTSGKYGQFVQNSGAIPGLGNTGVGYLAWWQLNPAQTTWYHYCVLPNGNAYKSGALISSPAGGSLYPYFQMVSGSYKGMTPTYNAGVAYAAWQANFGYGAGAQVIPTAPNGYVYLTNFGGTSAAGEPVWPTTIGATVTDGTVTWTNNGLSSAIIDDLVYSKTYTPTPAQILLLAGNTRELGAAPVLSVTGDMVNSAVVKAVAEVHGDKNIQFGDNTGAWQAAARMLEITLREV